MEPFENDKNQNTEPVMAENMTSAPAKRYEGKSFIFSDIPSQEKIIQVLCTTFGLDPEGKGDTLVLHNGDIEIRLAVASESAGEKAEEFIKRQVEGTCDHFYQVKTGVVDVKTNLLYQIGRARSFVLVEYAFDVEDEEDIEDKKTMIEDMFVSILNDLEGIILIQNQDEKEDGMFCSGENGEKLLILSDKGGSAFTRYLPYQEPDLKAGKDITQEQVDRRMRTMQTLIGNAIYVPGWLPAVAPASQITCPSLEETAQRALAIMGVAIYSECLLDEKQGMEKAQNFLMDYIDNNNTQDYFSPKEWKYLHDTAPDRKEILSFLRQYESLHVVEWALGLVEEIPTHLMGIAGTLTGCGPAFIDLVIEALGDAGVKYGISRETAYRMAAQMIVGTGKLYLETGTHPGAMKDMVCSPGGTTIRGVSALEKRGFRGTVIDAIDAIEENR